MPAETSQTVATRGAKTVRPAVAARPEAPPAL